MHASSKPSYVGAAAFIGFMFLIFGIGYYTGVESQQRHPERPPYEAFVEER